MLHDHEDIELFDQVFEAFWQGDTEMEEGIETMEVPAQSPDDAMDSSDDGERHHRRDPDRAGGRQRPGAR